MYPLGNIAGHISPAYRKLDTCWQHRAALTEGMVYSELGMIHSDLVAGCRARSLSPPSSSTVPTMRFAAYGCGEYEAVLFGEIAPRHGAVPAITDGGVSEANIELARGNRCISVGHKTPVTSSTLRALSRAGVEYISTRSVGTNHIDEENATSVGITVGNVAYSPDSVADYTLMLMLMALRNARSMMRRAENHDYRVDDVPGRELRDLTVGVIGTGRIGAAVIERLLGFGSRILAHDTAPTTSADYVLLDELLEQSDIVTLHTPLTTATHHLLGRRRLEQMKPGSILINTGRGPLIDTAALTRALGSGRLGGAALDVVEGEEGIFYADRGNPPGADHPLGRLHEMPNVLISPHTAYYTDHALADAVENSIVNCRTFESRHPHE